MTVVTTRAGDDSLRERIPADVPSTRPAGRPRPGVECTTSARLWREVTLNDPDPDPKRVPFPSKRREGESVAVVGYRVATG